MAGKTRTIPKLTNGWAAAIVPFDGRKALGIRWNGDKARPQGNPSSHGQPTWFIVPKELEEAFLEIIKRFAEKKPFKFDLESMITLISGKGFTVTVQLKQ
jgi:hypothetical protein